MSNILVKFQKDYADEFDVYGICIMSPKEWVDYLKEARNDSYPNEKYFGTNECIDFHDYQDVMNSFTVELLSDKEALFMRTILGDEFGWFPHFGDY